MGGFLPSCRCCLTGAVWAATVEEASRVHTQIEFSNSLCVPCVFPVQPEIFPVPIYVICEYYIHKTDLPDLSTLKKIFKNIFYPIQSGNLQLDQTKFLAFSLCFGNISKLPLFSLTAIFCWYFPCFPRFPCAVGTLSRKCKNSPPLNHKICIEMVVGHLWDLCDKSQKPFCPIC